MLCIFLYNFCKFILPIVQHQVRISPFNNLTLKLSVHEQYTQKLKQNVLSKRFLFKLYSETI